MCLQRGVKIEGKSVVVCGGNAVGCETADYLARRGNRVILVEMLERIGMDIEPACLSALKEELATGQVKIMTGRRMEAVEDDGVIVIDGKGTRTALQADMVVLAVGVEPVNELVGSLEGKVEKLCVLGDAKKPGKIHDAVADAFMLAFSL